MSNDNKYQGYTYEQKVEAIKELAEMAADYITNYYTAESIYNIFSTLFDAHPNVMAFLHLNPYYKEAAAARNKYIVLLQQLPNHPPECYCGDKSSTGTGKCTCLDIYNSQFDRVMQALGEYNRILGKNYDKIVDWNKTYYQLWFTQTYGQQIEDKLTLDFAKKKQEEIAKFDKELEEILNATTDPQEKERLRKLHEDQKAIQIGYAEINFARNKKKLVSDAIKLAMEQFSVDAWVADGNLDKYLQITLPPPKPTCDCKEEGDDEDDDDGDNEGDEPCGCDEGECGCEEHGDNCGCIVPVVDPCGCGGEGNCECEENGGECGCAGGGDDPCGCGGEGGCECEEDGGECGCGGGGDDPCGCGGEGDCECEEDGGQCGCGEGGGDPCGCGGEGDCECGENGGECGCGGGGDDPCGCGGEGDCECEEDDGECNCGEGGDDPCGCGGEGDCECEEDGGECNCGEGGKDPCSCGGTGGCECDEDGGECGCGDTFPAPPEPPPPPPTVASPLILDLNGDGVKTKSKEDGVYFDHDGNGFGEKSGWVDANDGLLVWDRNGNGLIDDGTELFGNNFILSNGEKAANGFEALKEFDSNGDGIVDANDDRWSELRVWVDKNGDGIVDEGELLTLEEAGVAGIHVDYDEDEAHTDENGNLHGQKGKFIRDDGTVGDMSDVWFDTDSKDTKYLREVEVSEDVKKLPNMKGWGEVPSLHQAMMLDETGELKALVERFVAADPLESKEMVWEILWTWTGSKDIDPAERGDYVDGRKLDVLEKLIGEVFLSKYCWGTYEEEIHARDSSKVNAWMEEYAAQVTSYLMLVTHYNDLYQLTLEGMKNCRDGLDPTAFDGLRGAIREMYEGGPENYCVITDFFAQLRLYDSKGIAGSLMMQELFSQTEASPDIFDRFFALMWGEWHFGGENDDTLSAGSSAALLIGGDGDDILRGGAGDDLLLGGDGDDTLYGGGGNDLFWGGAGNDTMHGGWGDNTFLFGVGDGHDTVIVDEPRADKRNIVRLLGLNPDDIELGSFTQSYGSQDLIIRIKSTGETLTVRHGMVTQHSNANNRHSIQAIEFADGTVWEWEDILHQPLYLAEESTEGWTPQEGGFLVGNNNGNTLTGSANDDILFGGDGDDTLIGGAGNDILWGGAGNDILRGGNGDDIYLFGVGDGHDTIIEDEPREDKRDIVVLAGLLPDDIDLLVSSNDLIIRIKSTGETLTIKNGISTAQFNANHRHSIQAIEFADGTVWEWEDIVRQPMLVAEDTAQGWTGKEGGWLVGNDQGNTLTGSENNDILHGGAGDDTLNGGAGNDILWGGAGNDILRGGNGDDTYLFGVGDGHDTVIEDEPRAGKRDVVRLLGLVADDIELIISSNDLIIRIKSTGETLTIKNGISTAQFNANHRHSIQAIEFADGTVWQWEDIVRQPMLVAEDTAQGWTGKEGGWLVGNDQGNTLTGSENNDILHGGAGDDILRGGDGNDVLWGGAGNDTLYGGNGDDIYLFGAGDGHDTIIEDEVNTGKRNIVRLLGLNPDDIELGTFTQSYSTQDLIIRIKSTGETLTIRHGISTQHDNANNRYSIQAIEFADGTVWEWDEIIRQPMYLAEDKTEGWTAQEGGWLVGNDKGNTLTGSGNDDILHGGAGDDTLLGGAGNDILWGGAGNDVLRGGNGDDTYLFGVGDGHDTVIEDEPRAGKRDVVKLLDLTPDDIELIVSSNDLIIRIKSTGETLTIKNGISTAQFNANHRHSIQAIEFADGTVWEWEDIIRQPMLVAEDATQGWTGKEGGWLVGNDKGNTLTGSSSDDILHGGAGDDILRGGDGNDVLWGGAGNDTLYGGNGDDIYLFGVGDGHDIVMEDEVNTMKRNIVRLLDLNPDDIELGTFSQSYSTQDLIIRIKSTGETLTIRHGISTQHDNANNRYSIQAIEFADGTVWEWDEVIRQPMFVSEDKTVGWTAKEGGWLVGNDNGNTLSGSADDDILHGGAGDDTLLGGAGNDVLWGGAGNDRLEGGVGDDTYLFGRGDGHDVIYETETRADRRNVVRLMDLNADDIRLESSYSASGYLDLIIRIKSTGETLTINRGIYVNGTNVQNPYSIQAIEFADGTVWEWDDIISQPIYMGENDKNSWTTNEGGWLIGNDIGSVLTGGTGDDILYGGAGDDIITGGAGNDILWGGAGNDRLEGGVGDDTYLFGRGDGHDVIYEAETRADRRNVVRLMDLNADDIRLESSYSASGYLDLIIRIKSTGETLTINRGIYVNGTNVQNPYSIQAIEFADGTVWEWDDIIRQPIYMGENDKNGWTPKEGGWLIGNDVGSVLTGGAGDDILYGGAGNDIITGGAGNDILWGGAGNDRLEGGVGDDTYLFGRGDGHDTILDTGGDDDRLVFGDGIGMEELWFSRSGNNLVIDILGSDDKVTIERWYQSGSYMVENITAGGMELHHSQLDQLLQALAAFDVDSGGYESWTQEQRNEYQAVVSSYWRSSAAG